MERTKGHRRGAKGWPRLGVLVLLGALVPGAPAAPAGAPHGQSPAARPVARTGSAPSGRPQQAPAQAPSGRAPRVRSLHAELSALPAEAFAARAEELLRGEPGPALDALLLLAGRPVPPNLGAAPAQARKALGDRARAVLREAVGVGSYAQDEFRDRLAQLGAGPGSPADRELLGAALRVAGALGLVGSLDSIERAVDSPDPNLRQAGLEALHSLAGRWFADGAQWDAHRASLQGLAPDPRTATPLQAAERELRTALGALYTHEPARAVAALQDPVPDPDLRILAVTRLREAVGRGVQDPDQVAEALLAQLVREADLRAFAAEYSVLLDLVAGSGADSDLPDRLAGTVRDLSTSGLRGVHGTLLDGLSRMTWGPTAGGEGGGTPERDRGAGARLATDLLLGILDDPLPRDPEEVARALDTWRAFVGTSGESVRRLQPRQHSRLTRALQELEGAEDLPAVLSTAVRASRPLVDGALLGDLLERVRASDTERSVRLELLNGLRKYLASEPAPGGAPELESARGNRVQVATVLLELLADPDAGVRTTALEQLSWGAAHWPGEGDLAPLGLTLEAWLDPLLEALAQDLSAAGDRSMVPGLLLLASKVESPGHLRRLLDEDAFEPLWSRTGAERDPVVVTAAKLADGKGALALSAARRLWDEAGQQDTTALASALRLGLGIPEDVASDLSPDDHRQLVRWAHALRRVRGRVPLETSTTKRLLDVHLPKVLASGETEDAHLRALALHLRALLLGGQADPGSAESRAEAQRAFQAALAAARVASGPPPEGFSGPAVTPVEVKRDLARMLESVGEPEAAAEVYAELVQQDRAAIGIGATGPGVLSSEDRRRAAQLLQGRTTPVRAQNARLAAELLTDLVHSESWESASNDRRLADLEALAEAADRTGDLRYVRGALDRLGDVSEPLPEATYELGQVPAEVPEFPTRGLCLTAAAHRRLRAVHDALRDAEARIVKGSVEGAPPAEGAPDGTGEGGADPADPEEDGGTAPGDGTEGRGGEGAAGEGDAGEADPAGEGDGRDGTPPTPVPGGRPAGRTPDGRR